MSHIVAMDYGALHYTSVVSTWVFKELKAEPEQGTPSIHQPQPRDEFVCPEVTRPWNEKNVAPSRKSAHPGAKLHFRSHPGTPFCNVR